MGLRENGNIVERISQEFPFPLVLFSSSRKGVDRLDEFLKYVCLCINMWFGDKLLASRDL